MSTRKAKTDAATQREEARKSLQDMLANPQPINNVSAVGADKPSASTPEPEAVVVQPQVAVDEVANKPEVIAQTEVQDQVATPASVAEQSEVKETAEVVQPQQVAEPAQVAQEKEPVPAQPQPAQESAPVSDSPQNQMAAAMVAMMFKGQLNPEFLKESNVSTPLDPVRAQLLKLAGTLTKKSQKLIMTEALDMWLKSHGFVQPPQ